MLKKNWKFVFLLLFLSSCAFFGDQEGGPAATQTAAIPTAVVTPTLQNTPPATDQPELPPVVPADLNVWVAGELSVQTDTPAGEILVQQLAAFDANHPSIMLNVESKSPSGQGGTLSYLRSGRSVAPSILPDLIALPAEMLPAAATEQLIFPLEGLISQDMQDDLFPAASTFSEVSGVLYGYPYAMTNIHQLAYSTTAYTQTVPLTWNEFVEDEDGSFVFPAAGPAGAELALQFYTASGGEIATGGAQPTLDVDALTNALNQFSLGRSSGLIVLQSSNLTTLEEAWQVHANGAADTVQTEATLFLAEWESGTPSSFAPIPGLEGPLEPLAMGWVWAISTPDPARQELAVELLNWLASGANMGEWSYAAAVLPARRSAFEQWPGSDQYVAFIQDELERAVPFPGAANSTVMGALSAAVFDVVSLAKSPQVAAEEAAATLQP